MLIMMMDFTSVLWVAVSQLRTSQRKSTYNNRKYSVVTAKTARDLFLPG